MSTSDPRPRRAATLRLVPRALLSIAVLAPLAAPAAAREDFPDEAVLQELLGRPALRIPGEGVLHFYWWRRDVPIVWQGRPVEVFEGDSLRLSVQREDEECLASGRWLVFADEAMELVATLSGGGLRVVSVVPRFPGATPQPFELRFLGRGTEAELGAAVAAALDRVQEIRADGSPPAALPTSDAAGPSGVSVAPLEALFGCKAEVKDGVALFRLPGPPEVAGRPAAVRMGMAVVAAFAGRDDAARVRLDWTMRPDELPTVLGDLARRGFALESLAAAAPGLDDRLSRVSMVAKGTCAELARAIRTELGELELPPRPVEAAFETPRVPEVLGLAGGTLGARWHADATLPAGPERATWAVREEAGRGPIACMSAPGDFDSKTFNLLWSEEPRFRDGAIVLRMRADRGRIDQGGGPIWRVRDANNYYVCRFNPLEQDFRVYRVKDGVRTQIQAIGALPFASGDWFTIRVDQVGDRITCTLNDSVVLKVTDDTFPEAGGVGLWSKADSQPSVAGLWVTAAEAGN